MNKNESIFYTLEDSDHLVTCQHEDSVSICIGHGIWVDFRTAHLEKLRAVCDMLEAMAVVQALDDKNAQCATDGGPDVPF